MKPPRALFCRFPLGRPLGKPNDAAYQRRVIDAAFTLLERDSGPVLEEFPDVIEGEPDTPLACPVPPHHDPSLPKAVDEAVALRPAYDRQLAASGRTIVGKVLGPDRVPEAVGLFVRIAEGEAPWEELKALGVPRFVAQDIRAYFEEAAMALAAHVPAANQAEAWFFRNTAAGAAVRRAALRMKEAGAPQPDWGFLAPRVYLD